MKATTFTFDIGGQVKIRCSGEQGEVIGRAEYSGSEDQYLIRYRCADGRATQAWWEEDALEDAEQQKSAVDNAGQS